MRALTENSIDSSMRMFDSDIVLNMDQIDSEFDLVVVRMLCAGCAADMTGFTGYLILKCPYCYPDSYPFLHPLSVQYIDPHAPLGCKFYGYPFTEIEYKYAINEGYTEQQTGGIQLPIKGTHKEDLLKLFAQYDATDLIKRIGPKGGTIGDKIDSKGGNARERRMCGPAMQGGTLARRRSMVATRPISSPSALEWHPDPCKSVIRLFNDSSNAKLQGLQLNEPSDAMACRNRTVADPDGSQACVFECNDQGCSGHKATSELFKVMEKHIEMQRHEVEKQLERASRIPSSSGEPGTVNRSSHPMAVVVDCHKFIEDGHL